ncbi:hypothetical protein ABPG72_005481 [Tetrahymena utriculariae]
MNSFIRKKRMIMMIKIVAKIIKLMQNMFQDTKVFQANLINFLNLQQKIVLQLIKFCKSKQKKINQIQMIKKKNQQISLVVKKEILQKKLYKLTDRMLIKILLGLFKKIQTRHQHTLMNTKKQILTVITLRYAKMRKQQLMKIQLIKKKQNFQKNLINLYPQSHILTYIQNRQQVTVFMDRYFSKNFLRTNQMSGQKKLMLVIKIITV